MQIYIDQPEYRLLSYLQTHDLDRDHPELTVNVVHGSNYSGTVTFVLLEANDGMKVIMRGRFGNGVVNTNVYYDKSNPEDALMEVT